MSAMNLRRLLRLAIAGTLAGQVLQAAAETAESGPVLEEVVVTAQKRTERLRDIPVSVSVLDAASLAKSHANGLADYFAQVPGLALNPATSGRLSAAIRGITTGGTANSTVGITLDDVLVGSSTGITYSNTLVADIDPAMLERVEVLRGPQGTLYGASSLGGLLRYVTVEPDLEQFSGRLQIDGSDVAEGETGYSVRGYVNAPVSDGHFGISASAFFRHDAGFVDNNQLGLEDVDSADTVGGRVSALWAISDAVSLRLSALYQDTEGDGSSDIETDASLRPLDGYAHNRNAGTGMYERTIEQYNATLAIDFGWAEMTSVTGFGTSQFRDTIDDTDFLGFLTEIVTGRDDLGTTTFLPADSDRFSQEIRLASPAGQRLEWLAGAFYTRETSDVQYNIYATDPATGAIVGVVLLDSFPSELEEIAVFGALTMHFSDRFDVQVGGRQSSNDQEYDETISGPLFDPPYVVHASSSDSSLTYQVSPRYRISPETMVYGRVATGYRPGGPNPGAGFGFPTEYDADSVTSYEAGIKTELLGRRLSLDLSVYNIDWDDIQLQQRDPDTQFLYYTNAGKARSRGLELTLMAVPATGLDIEATLAYTDAELSEPTSGGIVADAGDALPFSADWTATLALDKEFNIRPDLDAFVGGTVAYVGNRFGNFASAAGQNRVEMPSYTTVDLRAGVIVSGWTLSVFARNVADEYGVLGAEPDANDVYVANIVRPRVVGLSVSRSF
jgi:outer membrane receptor protein involved in Fe transport